MNASELRDTFPHQAKNIKQDPLADCLECKGTGQKGKTVCLCACVSESDPEVRREGTKAFYDTIRRLKSELHKK